MKGYSIRLKFGIMQKDLKFMIEDENDADKKWEEACEGLEAVGDGCISESEFFQKASEHYKSYGFDPVAK